MNSKLLLRVSLPLLATCLCRGQVSLSLHDAVVEGLANNPSAAISRERVDQAQALKTQAALKPNPRLYLQTEDIRWWGNPAFSYWHATEDYAYLGQVFETGGKRARRIDVASADVHASELQDNLVKRQLQATIIMNYWTAAGAAQLRDLYQRYLRTYQEDEDYIRNRVKEGVTPEVDLMRIQIERDRVRVQSINAARDYERASVELYRAMGRTDFPETTLTDPLDKPVQIPLPDIQTVLADRLEDHVSRQAIARAEANLKLQQANAKPDPEALAGYKRDVNFDTLYAALQIDLPVRNRNQGNIGSAQAELSIAKSNLYRTDANIRADFASALREYQLEQSTVSQLPQTRATADETVRLARAAYREGGIDLLRLLDAERSRIDFEIQSWQNLVQLRQGILNLQMAAGTELLP